MIRQLPIDQIDIRKDARAIDTATVAGLMESIGAVGLINPIRVRESGGRWEVIAGVHRLTACKQLNRETIDTVVVTDDDLHAELAMIDENLMRAELSASDRAVQTARRKAIYLELHPETAVGENQHTRVRQLGEGSQAAERFTANTAKAIGQSERAVQRDAERGEKVIPEVIDLIRGTKLDTGTYLDKLKKLTPNDQLTAAKRDLAKIKADERAKAHGGIARRVRPLTDEQVAENQFQALVALWNKTGELGRRRFLDHVNNPSEGSEVASDPFPVTIQ
jgi:ParB-like chromosome segregation protein Spo0J